MFGKLLMTLGMGPKPKVHYRKSKHDKIKKWAAEKPQSFWDDKKKR
jgi:hypothetical protein